MIVSLASGFSAGPGSFLPICHLALYHNPKNLFYKCFLHNKYKKTTQTLYNSNILCSKF